MSCGKYLIENNYKIIFGKLITRMTSGILDLDLLGRIQNKCGVLFYSDGAV